jgi:hypothetical protein
VSQSDATTVNQVAMQFGGLGEIERSDALKPYTHQTDTASIRSRPRNSVAGIAQPSRVQTLPTKFRLG